MQFNGLLNFHIDNIIKEIHIDLYSNFLLDFSSQFDVHM